MTDIAQMTGFDSSSRFSKVFHQIEGLSPSSIRTGNVILTRESTETIGMAYHKKQKQLYVTNSPAPMDMLFRAWVQAEGICKKTKIISKIDKLPIDIWKKVSYNQANIKLTVSLKII